MVLCVFYHLLAYAATQRCILQRKPANCFDQLPVLQQHCHNVEVAAPRNAHLTRLQQTHGTAVAMEVGAKQQEARQPARIWCQDCMLQNTLHPFAAVKQQAQQAAVSYQTM
jgi:hypothetical protein